MLDACGEGEYPLADSSPDALWNVPAVVFEGKLAFEAVVDRFDPLATDEGQGACESFSGVCRWRVGREGPENASCELGFGRNGSDWHADRRYLRGGRSRRVVGVVVAG